MRSLEKFLEKHSRIRGLIQAFIIVIGVLVLLTLIVCGVRGNFDFWNTFLEVGEKIFVEPFNWYIL